MLVNELIKSYRMANGLTQQEMAEKMHMSKQTYARMEKGETEMTDTKVKAFAKVIGKTSQEVREMADKSQISSLFQDNENHAQDNGQISNLTINNYYGDVELNLRIQYLENLLVEKEKRIALLEKMLEQ